MSTCCTGLSKSWWWLFMLLGFVLLYFLMLTTKQTLIEHNLQTRVQQQLRAENIKGATVTLEQRGRDVLLSGSATTIQERRRIVKIVNKINGIRVISNAITVPSQTPPTLVLFVENQTLLLSGIFPSQEQIDEFVKNARLVYGENNVRNELSIGDNIASPTWLSDSKLLFPILKATDRVSVTLARKMPVLSGFVYSEAERSALHHHVQGLLSMPVSDQLVIKNPTQAADITAHIKDNQLILVGKLSSQSEVDDILDAISKPLDRKEINNQLVVSHNIIPKEGRLTLLGQADGTTHKKLKLAARDFIQSTGSTFTLNDHLVRKEIDVKKSLTIKPSASSPRSKTVTKAVTVCQSELDLAMSGKSIHFSTNKADLKESSSVLLDNIVSIITDCKSALKGTEIVINGYTDSKGNENYNANLSQKRADAVKRYLNKAGIAHKLLKAKGFGEAQPISSNDTKAGRAKNRRITFSVINKQLVVK